MNTTEELKKDLVEAMRQTIKLPQYANRDSWSAPEMAEALLEQGLLGLNSTLDVRDAMPYVFDQLL